MSAPPLLLIVGDDALVERVCAELTSTAGHHVRVVWTLEPDRERTLRALGVDIAVFERDSDQSLIDAGVLEAASILALSDDDGLNLAVALRARRLNGRIRVVLRQFNMTLGAKLEQLLPDCTALSLAAHSAATYAGSALDQGCFFALRFPAGHGPLVGFAQHTASDIGISGLTVGQAEQRLGARIVALDSRHDPLSGALVGRNDAVVTFGPIVECQAIHRDRDLMPAAAAPAPPLVAAPSRTLVQRLVGRFDRANPILRGFAIAAVFFFSGSYCYFHFVLGKTLTASAFYVVETMTNVGFGEVGVTQRGALVTAGAIIAMLGGIVFTSIFIGSVASALTRAQWVATQGLRRIRARRHIVICGGGKIGMAVLRLLTGMGKRVIVIEPNPSADLVRRAQERDVDLLTGDGTQDGALDLCDIANASAVLALTGDDTLNLETALGARVRAAQVPLVVRMENASFAAATAELFGISTFSPAALTAPAFAGLARFPGTRGRVRFASEDFTIGQRQQGEKTVRPPADVIATLCVWRQGSLLMLREFEEVQPFDLLLFAVPLAQFRHTDPTVAPLPRFSSA
jgi:Trk K+ transport system NAD-binding subunit